MTRVSILIASDSAFLHRFRRVGVRALLALVIAGAMVWYARVGALSYRDHPGSDLTQVWVGAREMLAGRDPYAAVGPGRLYPWPGPLAYPATAMVAVIPLSGMTSVGADLLFVGLSFVVLTFALTRRELFPAVACLSWPALLAAHEVQWSPLYTAALVYVPLAALFAAKPVIAVPYLLYSPTRRGWAIATLGGLVLTGLALWLRHDWVSAWLHALRGPVLPVVSRSGRMNAMYSAPVTRPGGFIVLAALLRWRRPEARLVAALACVPQTMIGYELLPIIAVVPRTLRQVMLLVASSWGIMVMYFLPINRPTWEDTFNWVGTFSVWLVFAPAVILILQRPNSTEPALAASAGDNGTAVRTAGASCAHL